MVLRLFLFNVSRVLEEINVCHWPLHGTLLGLIRERHLINSDYDIDLGVFRPDCEIIFSNKRKFENIGYKVIRETEIIPKIISSIEFKKFILTPCIRIYDCTLLFAELKWFHKTTKREAYLLVYRPLWSNRFWSNKINVKETAFASTTECTMLCDGHPFCWIKNSCFPLTKKKIFGLNITKYIKSKRILQQEYKNWKPLVSKGLKIFFCSCSKDRFIIIWALGLAVTCQNYKYSCLTISFILFL